MIVPFALSMALAAFSSFLYHLVLKLAPGHIPPALLLAVTYAVSFSISVGLLFTPWFSLKAGLGESLAHLPWQAYALGACVVGIELGFLWAYRVGWHPGLAGVFANALSGSALLLVAALFFRDVPTLRQGIGFVVCLFGLWLLSPQK